MTQDEKKMLAMELAKLGLLKGRELSAPAIAAYADALAGYDLPAVLAACRCAALTPGWFELASITAHLGGDIAADAVLAWSRQGGDPAIAEQARRAVGLNDRMLTEEQVRYLRRPFLETYTALAARHRHNAAAAAIAAPTPTPRLS